MEIRGSLFARGDQIYVWANGFRTEVARLVNYLDQVTRFWDSELSEKEGVLNAFMKFKWNMNHNEWIYPFYLKKKTLNFVSKNLLNGTLSYSPGYQNFKPTSPFGS